MFCKESKELINWMDDKVSSLEHDEDDDDLEQLTKLLSVYLQIQQDGLLIKPKVIHRSYQIYLLTTLCYMCTDISMGP